MKWLQQRGGKRALVMRALTTARIILTSQRRFVQLPAGPVRRLVFVCSGNICRSPYAEAAARRLGMVSASAGLRAGAGALANPQAVEQARRRGLDLSSHHAHSFDPKEVQPGDLLVAFELWQVEELELLVPARCVPIVLIGALIGLSHYHMHDPYGHSAAYFERCFELIDVAVERARSLVAAGTP